MHREPTLKIMQHSLVMVSNRRSGACATGGAHISLPTPSHEGSSQLQEHTNELKRLNFQASPCQGCRATSSAVFARARSAGNELHSMAQLLSLHPSH